MSQQVQETLFTQQEHNVHTGIQQNPLGQNAQLSVNLQKHFIKGMFRVQKSDMLLVTAENDYFMS